MAFISKFKWPMAVLADADACRRVAYENVGDAKREGIDYIELRFSPWFMAEANQLNPVAVVEAVVDGIAAGVRDFGVKVKLIGILSRTYGPETASKELEALLSQQKAICALDLAGDEAHFPAEWFQEHFHRARDAGWHITAHAGEITRADSIWHAIRELKAERIGHALSAVEDPALMDYLAEHCIGRGILPHQQRANKLRPRFCQPPSQDFPRTRHLRDDQHRRPGHQRDRPTA